MGRSKADKRKTKAELIAELTELRERLTQLEADGVAAAKSEADGEPHDSAVAGNGALAAPDALDSAGLDRLSEAVSDLLRRMVAEDVDIRLTAEERVGMVQANPGAAEQLIVNLFVTRAQPSKRS